MALDKKTYHDLLGRLVVTKEGKRLVIDLTKTIIRNSDGEIIGSSAIIRDITEKKKSILLLREELFS